MEGEEWDSEEGGEEYQSSGEDWMPGKGEGDDSSSDGEGDEGRVRREGVKRKLEFMDEGRGRRGRRGNLSKSRRLYSLGRGRVQNWEEEGGEVEEVSEGSSNEGDPQEGQADHADSSAHSPGSSRICLPPLRVKKGTRSPARRTKKERTRFPCALGCQKRYVKLRQHYMSKAHKLSSEDARRLVDSRSKPNKSKDGRYRRICSIAGCSSRTVRMADHIRRYHPELNTEDRRRACYLSERTGGEAALTPVSTQPPQVSDPLSPVRLTPRASTSRLAQPSQPGDLAGSLSPVDRRSIPESLLHVKNKLFPLVKRYWSWQLSNLGGGRSNEMARRSAQEVQAFFMKFGDDRIANLSIRNFNAFCDWMEKDKKKPGSILFYIRSIMKFLDFAMSKSFITVGRHVALRKALVNIQNSFARKSRVQRATAAQEQFHERLPPQVRSAYFTSDYVRGIQELLEHQLMASDFMAVRNYLLTAITLWNGHRPAVLRNLTIRDVLWGEITQVPNTGDEENVSDSTYFAITVGKHKTQQTWGAAIISLPPKLWLHLRRFITLIKGMFRLEDSSEVFLTESGTPFVRSSGINHCLKDSYSRSGVQKLYPQTFSATATRRLITTECRSEDPSSAALIAAQLCHSVAVADKVYAMKGRVALSASAVHLAERSISASAAKATTSQHIDESALSQGRGVDEQKDVSGEGVGQKIGDVNSGEGVGVETGEGSGEGEIEGEGDVWVAEKWEREEIGDVKSGEGVGVETGEGSGEGDVWVAEKWEGEEWAPEAVNNSDLLGVDDSRVAFPDLPLDRADFNDTLRVLLQDLDWNQILEDAQFWISNRAVSDMAQSTSIVVVADSLHDVLVKRFGLNLFQILQTEGPTPPEGNRDLPFVMTAIAACRLGVLFGSTVDPESIPSDTTRRLGFQEGSLVAREEARKEEERFALLPGDKDRLEEERRVDEGMRQELIGTMMIYEKREREVREENRRRGMASLVIHPSSPISGGSQQPGGEGEQEKGEEGGSKGEGDERGERGDGDLGSGRKFGSDVEIILRRVYGNEIQQAVDSGMKVLMSSVRRGLAEVNSLFPNLTAQQVRDKLFTISSQIRRRIIGEGKGKGKGKKSKK